MRYVLEYRRNQLTASDIQREIEAFWDEYDTNADLHAAMNERVEGLAALSPSDRRGLISAEQPGGFDGSSFIDIFLQGLLAKAAVELVWRSVYTWIAQRKGLSALGEQPKKRDRQDEEEEAQGT